MRVERLIESPTISALELAARFGEQRHQVLAENVANVDTPDFATRQLDPRAFGASLREALDRAERHGRDGLELRGNRQFESIPGGAVRVRPDVAQPDNVLFHDGTNGRLESLLTDVQQNAMSYQMTIELLKGKFNGLLNAIRGRTA